VSRTEGTGLELAREAGFDLAGIAPLGPPPDGERFAAWLDRGDHADMAWLERNRERIRDPRALLGGRPGSLLVVGLSHARAGAALADGARVARYAAGRDYHNVMGGMLRKLRNRLLAAGVLADTDPTRRIVDAGPLLERSHAARAGLGFLSKAANLLHPDFGPWFFLGELVLPIELEPTSSPPAGSCGTCTACLDACPTGAIVEPGRVDARRCISYHTIENRGRIPRELRPDHGAWVFGCDVCSEVCPWGSEAEPTARFGDHAALREGSLVRWLELRDEAEFRARFEGSPLSRAGRAGLARNAAIVLGNGEPSDEGRGVLLRALRDDPSPIVRETAAWALARAHATPDVRRAIEAAAASEADERSGAELRAALEGA